MTTNVNWVSPAYLSACVISSITAVHPVTVDIHSNNVEWVSPAYLSACVISSITAVHPVTVDIYSEPQNVNWPQTYTPNAATAATHTATPGINVSIQTIIQPQTPRPGSTTTIQPQELPCIPTYQSMGEWDYVEISPTLFLHYFNDSAVPNIIIISTAAPDPAGNYYCFTVMLPVGETLVGPFDFAIYGPDGPACSYINQGIVSIYCAEPSDNITVAALWIPLIGAPTCTTATPAIVKGISHTVTTVPACTTATHAPQVDIKHTQTTIPTCTAAAVAPSVTHTGNKIWVQTFTPTCAAEAFDPLAEAWSGAHWVQTITPTCAATAITPLVSSTHNPIWVQTITPTCTTEVPALGWLRPIWRVHAEMPLLSPRIEGGGMPIASDRINCVLQEELERVTAAEMPLQTTRIEGGGMPIASVRMTGLLQWEEY